MARNEDPSDIFIDVVDFVESSVLSDKFRQACGHLLKEEAGLLRDPFVGGYLCYLSARIGAEEAIVLA
ncbi:MAG: hypothetical protein HY647_11345 [Acidobacteria bacterium]|nr:hypothetical protein [Acidobacteriota bacterium]